MSIQDIRDFLIIIYLIVGIGLTMVLAVGAFFLTRGLLALVRSAKRPLDNLGEMSEALVEHVVEPLKEGVSFGSILGGSLSFMTGFAGSVANRLFKNNHTKARKGKR